MGSIISMVLNLHTGDIQISRCHKIFPIVSESSYRQATSGSSFQEAFEKMKTTLEWKEDSVLPALCERIQGELWLRKELA